MKERESEREKKSNRKRRVKVFIDALSKKKIKAREKKSRGE